MATQVSCATGQGSLSGAFATLDITGEGEVSPSLKRSMPGESERESVTQSVLRECFAVRTSRVSSRTSSIWCWKLTVSLESEMNMICASCS